MALTYPYPLAFLSELLHAGDVTFDLQRNDELSGSGDGRYWGAELARPLWTAEFPLQPVAKPEARAINARIHALDGVSRSFLLADPSYPGPAFGDNSGLEAVTVDAVRANRTQIGLAGLPNGFVATIGDYITILGPNGQVYFGQFLETSSPVSDGTIFGREVRPVLPLWVAPGQAVLLVEPYFRAIIPPGGFRPYRMNLGDHASGASLTILQKLP
ncbi:hypothetical protein [Paracoccus methylarcula]|uniref:Uncharacterized protein n=1 Tax=Paracoccus methylarcula TaxID=72022 RepID=A0A3R7NYH7_9RHOB|nr:hypothetical protein [Paracoccus methylarcula]RNF35386.1 hypothetical protein A7A09_007315 [Paracoccus methylarcula]